MEVGIKPHHRCLGKHTERRERGTVGHCTDQNKVCHWFMCMLYSIVQCDRFISLLHRNGFAGSVGFISSKNIVGIEIDDFVACFFLIILFFEKSSTVPFVFIFYTIPFTYNSLSLRAKKFDPTNFSSIEFDETSSLHWLGLYIYAAFFFLFILFIQKNITYPSYTFDMTRFVSFSFFFLRF